MPLTRRDKAKPKPPPPGEPTDAALYSVEGGVAKITLNRPDNKNALSVELVNALGDHIATAQADDAVRALLLTNVGTTFCAGADLKGKATMEPRHSLVDVLDAIIECPKPVVGRIAGHCTGGGVGLAAALDVSVVTEEAKIGFTEVRLGVCPAVISVVCLPKLRRADASELFLGGERVPASRAAAVGLVNYAVPSAELDAKVDEIPVARSRRSNALAATRNSSQKCCRGSRRGVRRTAPLSQRLFSSDEAKEGIAAFRERRDAAWVPEAQRGGTGARETERLLSTGEGALQPMCVNLAD